jgi:hypothetical protein
MGERVRWRKVKGWPYWHSEQGVTRSKYGPLKPTLDKDGYPYVTLRDRRRAWRVSSARLTLLTWVGPPPEPGMEACHSREAVSRQDSRKAVLYWGNDLRNARDKLERWSEAVASPPETGVTTVTSELT